jgi:hypothetical protein
MSSIEEGLFGRRAEARTAAWRDKGARNTGLGWAIAGWFMLLFAAVRAYPGSTVIYLLFSVAFLLLLFSAFYRQRTYGYTSLAVFLCLGFWLKVSWHLACGTSFPEPTEHFTGSPSHWDHALLVSTIGALAVLCARLVFQFFAGSRQTLRSVEGGPPHWLRAIRALMTALLDAGLQFSEFLLFIATRNPLLCASIGWLLNVSFAHFGGAPNSLLPGILFLLMVVILLAALQSGWIPARIKSARARVSFP